MFYDKINNSVQLSVANEGTLHTNRFVVTNRIEKHIALTQKFFCTAHIKNGTGVCLRRYCKSDSGRNICFYNTGNYINRRSLSCKDKMNTCCTSFLCQTQDSIFHINLCYHHQIGQFVDDYYDVRHFFYSLLIVAFNFTHVIICKSFVTSFHFSNCPMECGSSFLGISYNRNKQVRNAVVIG